MVPYLTFTKIDNRKLLLAMENVDFVEETAVAGEQDLVYVHVFVGTPSYRIYPVKETLQEIIEQLDVMDYA